MTKSDKKPAILLVSKPTRSADSIRKLLSSNFIGSKAEDAETAWKFLVKRQQITVIICELSLAIDQFGLLERIRNASDRSLAAKPVLLLVGEKDDENDREKAFRLGATDFINMPFSSTELTTRVRLHAQLFINHAVEDTTEMQNIAAVNVLQQLAQEKFFKSRLKHELSFSLRHKINVSVCKLKITNLKTIIAGFDKSAAISVVQAVAKIMQLTVRGEDILCYLGNAEFCILYPATNRIDAATTVNRFLKNIEKHSIRIAGKRVPVVISGSIASSHVNQETTVESLMKIVDEQLAEAISRGGNSIVSLSHPGEKEHISVAKALKMIERGTTDDLSAHAGNLLLDIMPLLEYADNALDLGLKSVNQSLRKRLKPGS
jgi:two-component system cell cycle response regulator